MNKQRNWVHAFTGILGALLGMLFCVFLSWVVGRIDIDFDIIVLIATAPIIIAGYRWCKGWKNLAFAYAVTGTFTFLGSILNTLAAISESLSIDNLLLLLNPASGEKIWIIQLVLSGMAMISYAKFRRSLCIYTADPRMLPTYAAAEYAGGMMYNMCPNQLPAQEIPYEFHVGSRLTVTGTTLRTGPGPLSAGKTFYVGEIAGVVFGGCTGSNVLYDRNFQVLAKFAWSMDGSITLLCYLVEHDVHFDTIPSNMSPELLAKVQRQQETSSVCPTERK